MIETIISGTLQIASSFGIGCMGGAIWAKVIPATAKPVIKVCSLIGTTACAEVIAIPVNKYIDDTVKETGKAIRDLKESFAKAKDEAKRSKESKEIEVDEVIVEEV